MSGEQDRPDLVSSDPAILRALAHPLRIEILSVLDEVQEATATEIAERVGDTPSNCSFHLRQLAKAGFIERGEARGTAKPWRVVHEHRRLEPDVHDPASLRASSAIAALYLEHEASRIRDHFLRVGADDDVSGTSQLMSKFWATTEELKELAEHVMALSERFNARTHDPSLRPPGSRLSRMFAVINPEIDAERTPTPDQDAE